MPQTYQIKAPDGNWLEVDSDTPPTDAQALAVVRAYGDAQAAKAQQKAQDLSTPLGIAKRTLSGAGSAIGEALNPMTYWNAEKANVADLRASQAATRAGDQTLGPEKPTGPPIREQLASLSDPETGGRAIGNLALGLALPYVAPKVPPALESTGRLITRGGEAMNPAITGRIGAVTGALTGLDLSGGGAGGLLGGERVGSAVGGVVPAATQKLGRLMTGTGRVLGGKPFTVPEGENVQYAPSSGISRELTPEEQVPPEGANVQYRPSDEQSRPLTPEEQVPPASAQPAAPNTLMKAPTLQEILNDVRQQQTEPGRVTAPAEAAPAGAGRQAFGTTSGTPAVTPERYHEIQATIPADAPRTADLDRAAVEAQRQAVQDAADAKAAAQQSSQSMPFDPANPETLGPPVHSGEILSDAVKQEIRQIAAEMDNLKFAKARGEFGGVGQGRNVEGPSGGTAGAPVYHDIVQGGGYGSRADVSREIDRVLDGTGGPNANTRAIIQTAKERVASQARPVVADQSYRTAAEREAQYYQDLTAREAAVKETPGSTGSTATPASGPGLREQLLEALQQRAKEQGIPLDTEALTHAMNDPDAFLGEIAQRYAPQEGDVSFDAPEAGAPAAGGITGERSSGTIPSREEMAPDELSRAREGARDSPDRQPGETVEDYRLRTRGRVTGEQSTDPSIIPARRSSGIDDTIERMYARNATDQEFRDYLAASKNHPKNGEIAAKIESKAHSWKRASPLAHVLVGAAAGGAALRQALVGQLQGDQKEQE